MATVYRARQDNLGRTVAIKYLDSVLSEDVTAVERFRREALATSEMNHRNIVTVHEFGEQGGRQYIVMELVDGCDLQGVLDVCTCVPPEVGLLLLDEVVEGLGATHAQGIIHRDVKPGNVLVSRSGDVKIADFGVARMIDGYREPQQRLTGLGLLGTPYYMAPEQVRVAAVDTRADVFSVGVMGYELVTGHMPFRGETMAETLAAITDGLVPAIELEDGCGCIGRMLERAMAKDVSKRIPTMPAFAKEIGACLGTLDPKGTLARHRRALLRRFGRDYKGFLGELQGLSLTSRLARYEALESTALPVRTHPQGGSGKATLKAPLPSDSAVEAAGREASGRKFTVSVAVSAVALAVTLIGSAYVLWTLLDVGELVQSNGGRNPFESPVGVTHVQTIEETTETSGDLGAMRPSPMTGPASPESPFAATRKTAAATSETSAPSQTIPSAAPSPAPKTAARPAKVGSGFVMVRCRPAGDIYVDDQLFLPQSEVALLELMENARSTVSIRHPEVFGFKSWSPSVLRGDTLELEPYVVKTGILRVVSNPPGPATVVLEGRETGEDTPFRKNVATGQHLLNVVRPGWIVQRVSVFDLPDASDAREIVPSDPSIFPGVAIQVREDRDQKIVFHLGPALP